MGNIIDFDLQNTAFDGNTEFAARLIEIGANVDSKDKDDLVTTGKHTYSTVNKIKQILEVAKKC